jgi:hypothetical protein
MMTHPIFGQRRDEINEYWNGSACDECNAVWPYWVIGIAVVALIAVGIWR